MSRTPDSAARFTLPELVELAARALVHGYSGPADARAREIPDPRSLRYYTTLGLLDRPAEMRGRTALYGRRHLMQVVAIKRLQADGRSLAEIQSELAGITDRRLERVAALPDELPPAHPALPPAGLVAAPSAAAPPGLPPASVPAATELGAPSLEHPSAAPFWESPSRDAVMPPFPQGVARRADRFWSPSTAPSSVLPEPELDDLDAAFGPVPFHVGRTAMIPGAPLPAAIQPPPSRPYRDSPPSAAPSAAPALATLQAIRLSELATLLVDAPVPARPLDAADLSALQAAAAPLLHALAERGLLPPRDPRRSR